MPAAALPPDEPTRLRALTDLGILDTSAEEEFDALARAAALVCGTPISLVSLVDAQRQWFKANVGLPGVKETPREMAFCAHALHADEILEVPDATADGRFADNPLVTGDPGIRFYAGAPLRTRAGERVGTLCVIDRRPRQLNLHQRAVLGELAKATVMALERRQVAMECAVARANFHALSESSPLGVFSAGLDGTLHYANRRWAEIFDLPTGTANADRWLEAVAMEDREYVGLAWGSGNGSPPAAGLQFRTLRPGAGVHHVRMIWHAIHDDHGQPLGRTGFAEDITANVLADEAQQAASENLIEQGVRKDRFLATLSHELRGPLTALRAGIHVLRQDDPASPRATRALTILDRQVNQMAALVEDLQDASAIAAGKVILRRSEFDLNEVIARAVETAMPVIEARRHTLSVDLTHAPLPVAGDVTRLLQVVVNLLINAAKYTPEAGHISLRSVAVGDLAVLDVADNGIGLEPEMAESVFGLFEQSPSGSAFSQGGLGIGLALVRQLTELHGGDVAVDSAGPGQGSRFTVRLPLAG